MKEIYLIRHAQAETNLSPHIIGGRSNHSPLTQLGEAQAKQLGVHLRKMNIKPDCIYSSGAIRTNRTAELSLAEAGIDLSFIENEALQELHQGDGTGKEKEIIYSDEVQERISKEGKDFRLPNGESMNDVSLRMITWFENNVKNHKGNIFLVYTHGVAIKCLLAHIENWPHKKVFETVIDNTSVTKVVFDDDILSIEYINRMKF